MIPVQLSALQLFRVGGPWGDQLMAVDGNDTCLRPDPICDKDMQIGDSTFFYGIRIEEN